VTGRCRHGIMLLNPCEFCGPVRDTSNVTAMKTADHTCVELLLLWSRLPLGKQRQRQFTVTQQAQRATVQLRFGERYLFTLSRPSLAEATEAALAVAASEEEAVLEESKTEGPVKP
jgi:hypothetical protein